MSICRHKKSGRIYVASAIVTNCTNAQDGQRMVLYRARGADSKIKWFAREVAEFLEKFEPVLDDSDSDESPAVALWS